MISRSSRSECPCESDAPQAPPRGIRVAAGGDRRVCVRVGCVRVSRRRQDSRSLLLQDREGRAKAACQRALADDGAELLRRDNPRSNPGTARPRNGPSDLRTCTGAHSNRDARSGTAAHRERRVARDDVSTTTSARPALPRQALDSPLSAPPDVGEMCSPCVGPGHADPACTAMRSSRVRPPEVYRAVHRSNVNSHHHDLLVVARCLRADRDESLSASPRRAAGVPAGAA